MSRAHTISIILQSRWGLHNLPRLFQSLAWQSAALDCLEVVFVDTGEDKEVSRKARLWSNILPCTFNFLNIAPSTRPHEAVNLGMAAAASELILLAHPTVRLDPYFLTDVLREFNSQSSTDVLYSDFVNLGDGAAGLVQLPRFARWRLKTRNIIGMLAVFHRKALGKMAGLRPDTFFPAWDLAVQGTLAGLTFQRVTRSLYTCTLGRPDEEEARQGAAMVVINNQGFFREDVVRWGLAATRRAPWALRYDPFRIPTAREVRQLFKEHVEATSRMKPSWIWRFTGPPPILSAPLAIYDSEAS